jgi:hypothetical protein
MNDFYIVAATIIPVLALANSITLVINAPGARGTKDEDDLDAVMRTARRVIAIGALPLGAFMAYAEWVCLRSIETGRSAPGGTTIVWVALAYLGIGLVLMQVWSIVTGGG